MLNERAELQRKLADARAHLEALPRADQVRHPHSVMARRVALEAKIKSLQERLSTAPVHNAVTPVDAPAETGDNQQCLDDPSDSQPSVVNNSPQDD